MLPVYQICIYCRKTMLRAECCFTQDGSNGERKGDCFHMDCYLERYP